MRPRTVPDCLKVVIEHGLVVGSRVVQHVSMDPPERRRHARGDEPALTSFQRSILRRLAAGLTHHQIAEAENVSGSTVERAIAALCGRFHVANTNALYAQAGRLGFID